MTTAVDTASASSRTTCPETFVAFAESLADAARSMVRKAFRSGLEVMAKADDTPVTLADREAEAKLRDLITKTYPEHGIFGEEYGPEREDADYVWVLDPIDGTKRFITGNPLFGTLIALLHEGSPILGVIDMSVLDERWVGALGRPTLFHNRDGTHEVRTRRQADLGEAVLYATSPDMFTGPDGPAFERLRRNVKMSLYGAECFAYGLLASGFTDLVVEADMAPYDYLAHVPVVIGAGGVMTDWEGRALTLRSGRRVVAGGSSEAHKAALDLLNHG